MTNKDYELIAAVFYREFLDLGGDGKPYNIGRADEWRSLVSLMANNLALDSPEFDKGRFMKACGL